MEGAGGPMDQGMAGVYLGGTAEETEERFIPGGVDPVRVAWRHYMKLSKAMMTASSDQAAQ